MLWKPRDRKQLAERPVPSVAEQCLGCLRESGLPRKPTVGSDGIGRHWCSRERRPRMTAIDTGAPPYAHHAKRLVWRLDTPVGLALMFSAALVLRVLLAPHLGFYGDVRLYRLWAERLADVGPGDFYTPGQFADYPPGYLYVLWVIGKISASPGYLLLKLPAILGDLGARVGRRRRSPRASRRGRCCDRMPGPRARRRSGALQPRRDRAQRRLGPGGRRSRRSFVARARCSCSSRGRRRCSATSLPSSSSRSRSR